eukprot:COSAG05_NODE_1314_length_5213_cov_3.285100_2_plen_129_part_00
MVALALALSLCLTLSVCDSHWYFVKRVYVQCECVCKVCTGANMREPPSVWVFGRQVLDFARNGCQECAACLPCNKAPPSPSAVSNCCTPQQWMTGLDIVDTNDNRKLEDSELVRLTSVAKDQLSCNLC